MAGGAGIPYRREERRQIVVQRWVHALQQLVRPRRGSRALQHAKVVQLCKTDGQRLIHLRFQVTLLGAALKQADAELCGAQPDVKPDLVR